jgi:hypothetical protein
MFSIGILGFLVWSFFQIIFNSLEYLPRSVMPVVDMLIWLEDSFLVALLYCEIKIINIAVCWNSLMLISTFQQKAGKNLISLTQSAGNLYTKSLKSSSEITRDTSFDFTLFNLFYSRFNQEHLALDPCNGSSNSRI